MRIELQKLKHSRIPEHLLVIACVLGSLIWGGRTFFGSVAKLPSRQVTLITSESTGSFSTSARTIGDFLREVGIEPSAADLVQPTAKTPVTPGIVVYYRKSVKVYLADAGSPEREITAAGETVCDLLDSAAVVLGPQDRVQPSTDTPVTPGMHISITRKDSVDIIEKRPIPPPVTYRADPSLGRGETVDVDHGSPGTEEATTRIYYLNGEEKARVEIKNRVLVEATPQVTRIGTMAYAGLASRGSSERPPLAGGTVMEMVATAYEPSVRSCWPYHSGVTASGEKAGRGVCAVDPRVIPLGTKLWVEGYGYALAADTGGAIKGNRIDVCFETYAEAERWGRKVVKVYILE